ncbi:MAG TPA: sigma-70 family RNA polymerase sigma factor [Candidatus Dormibacteraeota bacterium]|nr:sigma-70 family RNA polymerase sigma factor [Candidatus Dormibacteraeota bacterium]
MPSRYLDAQSSPDFRIEKQVLSGGGSAPSDVEVGRGLAAADLDAIAVLYDRYGSLAYSIALRILGDPAMAEDVVQESVLKLWSKASSFDPNRGSLRSWLVASVRNRAIDHLRGRGRNERREVDLAIAEMSLQANAGADPWREVSMALERDAVTEALQRLPAEQKQAIELAYYGGYSQREIAEISKVPLSTVKGRMRLALEKLHSYLEGKGLFDEP